MNRGSSTIKRQALNEKVNARVKGGGEEDRHRAAGTRVDPDLHHLLYSFQP